MYNSKPLIILLLYILLIFSCKSAPEQIAAAGDSRDIEYARMRPGIRNLDELTVSFTAHNIELDFRKSYYASEAQIFTGLFEGLFSYHPMSLQPVPALAERWEVSEDKTQWTFTIRRDARFSNGDPVRAEDFRGAWLSLLEPSRNSPYSSFFDVIKGANEYRNNIVNDPDEVGIIAQTNRTLIVKLNSPASFFPAMLCHHSFSPIHPSMIDKDEWGPAASSQSAQKKWMPPVSNGAYKIISIDNEKLVMQKSEHYWDHERVTLNKIIIKFSSDADEASHLWNSGESRWIAGDVNIESLTDLSGLQVNIMFATHYYYIRSDQKPWNDKRVRRAMALVLPWDEIRSVYHLPAKTLIFPISGYPEIEGITESDYGEALKLMSEAGYEDGVENELVIRIPVSRDAIRVAGIMSSVWKNVLKINVRVEVIPPERYFQSAKEENYTVGSITWIGDFADPYAFLQMWRKDSNLNDAAFNDSEFEALVERSMIEEGEERLATLAEAEGILLNTGAVLPVCFSPALNIVDTNELEGWYPNPLDIHPFKYLFFKTFRPLPGVAVIRK